MRVFHDLVVLSAAVACASANAAVLRVDVAGQGDFSDIQSAIDAASHGDTILVAPGEYIVRQPINFNGSRDPQGAGDTQVKDLVVKSEAGSERTIVRMSAAPVDPERACVVLFESGETRASVLDGFSLTGGVGNATLGLRVGGAVHCRGDSSPVIRNCTIARNAAQLGGGVYCGDFASPGFVQCTLSENTADFGGGLHSSANAAPLLSGCIIARNTARSGGGVYTGDASRAQLENCLIDGNRIEDGTADGDGGGVHADTFAQAQLRSCTITGNTGTGVVTTRAAFVTLISCIVWGNSSSSVGGAHGLSFSCVESAEVPRGEGNINEDPLFVLPGAWDDGGTPDDTHDDVWIEGVYRLDEESPCIDAGADHAVSAIDLQGNGRPCGFGADMGAYEYCGAPSPRFVRGDVNADAMRNLADATAVLAYLFGGGSEMPCLKAADADDSGRINLADAILLLNFFFASGAPPPLPFGACGVDPTADPLTCEAFAPCL